jgi:hypothetical protein
MAICGLVDGFSPVNPRECRSCGGRLAGDVLDPGARPGLIRVSRLQPSLCRIRQTYRSAAQRPTPEHDESLAAGRCFEPGSRGARRRGPSWALDAHLRLYGVASSCVATGYGASMDSGE